MDSLSKWLLVILGALSTLAFLGLAVWAWGDCMSFLGHPARLGLCVAALLLVFASGFADVNLSSGKREDTRSRWIFLPAIVLTVLWAWLPAYTERRGIMTFDGDAVRYAGLILFVIGGVLRVWPMFVLGRRFSGLVAIQEHHELATEGPYKFIRHPSYLGAFLALVGWVLVFRSGLGFLVTLPFMWLGIVRIDAEEALLESEFGDAYATYRRRTWRVIPLIY